MASSATPRPKAHSCQLSLKHSHLVPMTEEPTKHWDFSSESLSHHTQHHQQPPRRLLTVSITPRVLKKVAKWGAVQASETEVNLKQNLVLKAVSMAGGSSHHSLATWVFAVTKINTILGASSEQLDTKDDLIQAHVFK